MDTQTIVTIIIALIAATPGLLAFIGTLKKDTNDATSAAQKILLDAIGPLQDEIARLNTEVDKCHRQIELNESALDEKELRIVELEEQSNKVKQLEQHIYEKDEHIADLERIVEEKNCQIVKLQKEVNELKSRLTKVERRN